VPAHEYDSVGTFTVIEIVSNPSSCNGSDTFKKTLVVLPIPTAAFIDSPTIPVTNVPTYFTNQSVNATAYLWDFGDGATSKVTNPVHFFRKTGSYNVCLEALNNLGCSARVCLQVSSDVLPLADVPTGFSPNGDGSNDILYVRGAAIATLDFRIYNRWGEMVFETKDQSIGWDGTYKGQPQPIDAYAYILNVSFVDGTTLQKKGNVTLLR
ncbi:MAG TPA: gliding motility-associated C-terminal domain-containing protein, partial [Flavipsychrobacter sp.]|nr:gliding motility-associated C-terminal domain-containing protein [Flavipsychrobacter sp.]